MHGRRSVSISTMRLVFRKNDLPLSRFAVVVSTKIDKRATVRNRIKRLIRESVRLLMPEITRGVDCVLCAQGRWGQVSQRTVEGNVRELLVKAGALKKY
ncbi:ribonuclease P protein component [Patescibacteria group bacterium]|nr:ribonuclease P protein component [Patescibacteria group bacterium]MBU1472845.1 ribonuclease P protein component [Patescibacteria group bacterium]MBU2459502.1 ribonuclease P protein component [Patescibacteria group bacterium]MBU2543951.1 ribonuclease P protein component [Patescibacteria group bacterium]